MFLNLAHTRLDVFAASKDLIFEAYRVTSKFPAEEKYNLSQQIRRAALSVHLTIAEGCSRNLGAERKRYFIMSRGSVIELDTAFDIAQSLGYCTSDNLHILGDYIIKVFKLLCGLIGKEDTHH